MNDDLISKMLSLKTWAVAGSTHNPEKFAYKIYKKLKSEGFNVFSLNPSGFAADSDASYKTLGELPVIPEVINMVINPIRGKVIIDEAVGLGIKYIWFQPGAETSELIKYCEEKGLNVIHNRCVLVELV